MLTQTLQLLIFPTTFWLALRRLQLIISIVDMSALLEADSKKPLNPQYTFKNTKTYKCKSKTVDSGRLTNKTKTQAIESKSQSASSKHEERQAAIKS